MCRVSTSRPNVSAQRPSGYSRNGRPNGIKTRRLTRGFTAPGSPKRSGIDGANVTDLVTGLNFPAGVALDVGESKMYWADALNHKIQRANMDGSGVEDLVDNLGAPYFVALDLIHGHVYWTDYGTDKIQRSDLDGSNVVDLVTTGLQTPRGVTLDLVNDQMYWADRGTDVIQRSNLDGSNVETLVDIDIDIPAPGRDPAPHGVALDLANQHLYWVDNGTVKIHRSDLDGNNIETLVDQDSGFLLKPWQIVLDLNLQSCDFNESGVCDGVDMDLLSSEVRDGSHRQLFNLNPTDDELVNETDRQLWLQMSGVSLGDANLDGQVDEADFNILNQNIFQPGGFGKGDFTGDGLIDGADFNIWNNHRLAPASPPVPEPSSFNWIFSGLLLAMRRSR